MVGGQGIELGSQCCPAGIAQLIGMQFHWHSEPCCAFKQCPNLIGLKRYAFAIGVDCIGQTTFAHRRQDFFTNKSDVVCVSTR